MSNPEDVRRDRIKSSWRNAENCRALAANAVNAGDRFRWLSMSKFWVDRAKSSEAEQEALEGPKS